MRTNEILAEYIVRSTQLGDYTVNIDSHSWDRQSERVVTDEEIERTLRKLPQAKAKFKQLGNGQAFWLYDNEHNIALGIRVTDQDKKIFKLKTVWPGRPTGEKYPLFNVA